MTKDKSNDLVWENREVEEDPDGYLAAQNARREREEEERKRTRDAADLDVFKTAWIEAGGSPDEVEAAYKRHKNRMAEESAITADGAALRTARTTTRSAL